MRLPKLSLPGIALLVSACLIVVALGFRFTSQTDVKVELPSSKPRLPNVAVMIAKMEKQLRDDPDDVAGWEALGWSYTRTAHYTDAVRAYRRLTELQPDKAEPWSALGESIVMSGQQGVTNEALDAFHKALAINPHEPKARFFVGAAKGERGDPNGALNDWIALLKDSPPHAPWIPSLRQKIDEASRANKIDVSARLSLEGGSGVRLRKAKKD